MTTTPSPAPKPKFAKKIGVNQVARPKGQPGKNISFAVIECYKAAQAE